MYDEYTITVTNNSANIVAVSPNQLATQTAVVMTEIEKAEHSALIAVELYRLRTAYPVQARNFSEEEAEAMNALWSEIFMGVDLQLMHEATMRFIITNKTGFFPSPGQIVDVIEQIIKEREIAEREASQRQHAIYMRWYYKTVEQGYNCGNCRHCKRVFKDPNYYTDSKTCEAWEHAKRERDGWLQGTEDWQKANAKVESYRIESFLCRHEKGGHYHENEDMSGTTADQRCDCFEGRKGLNLPPLLSRPNEQLQIAEGRD